MLGAGGENRTLIACLEGRHISHYTTPANTRVIIPYIFILEKGLAIIAASRKHTSLFAAGELIKIILRYTC